MDPSFVGRVDDLRALADALAHHAIVTVTGPPGIGKTRLAREAATATVAAVDLVPVNDVARAVATALALRDRPGTDPADAVTAALATRAGTLLLDNCEHVVAAVADLVEALRERAPGVTVLATSREPLGVAGEHVLALGPLHDDDAVALFRDRAPADAQPGTVAEVCRRLDGTPLAIELAAATLRSLTIDQLAERLDARLDLLVAGPRTAPPRHRSLRAALDASHALLDDDERGLLARLAAFAGSFPLDAVEAVADLPPGRAVATLDRLVAKSLVAVERPRYRLPESIRLYARERDPDPAASDAALTRWANAVAHRPDDWAAEKAWLDRVAAEDVNLTAALDRGADIATALAPAWLALGRLATAERYLRRRDDEEAALAAQVALAAGRVDDARRAVGPDNDHPRARLVRAQLANAGADYATVQHELDLALADPRADADTVVTALVAKATAARAQGDYATTLAHADRALDEAERAGHRRGVATALLSLAAVRRLRGEVDAARADLERALAIAHDLNAPNTLAVAYGNLGSMSLETGDPAGAVPLLERSLAASRASGDQRTTLVTLFNLAESTHLAGDPDGARPLYGEALAIARALDERRSAAWILGSLGDLSLNAGDVDAAASLYRESLAVREAVLDRRGLAIALDAAAAVGLKRANAYAAARLLGAATALRERVGAPREPTIQQTYDALLAAASDALDATSLADALGAGAALDLPGAVAEARRVLDAEPPPAPRPPPAVQTRQRREVRTLGGFAVVRDGEPVDPRAWQSKKARDLLKLLVAHRGRPVPREVLADLLWPDGDPAALPNRLSVALSTVRAVLDPERTEQVVVADRTAAALNLDLVAVDVERFLADVAAGRLAEAERAYTGDFLPEDAYEEWSVALREQARLAYVGAARTLARAAARDGDHDEAARLSLRILERDPYDEAAHRALGAALADAGRHGEARAARDTYVRRMREIGVEVA